MTPPARPKDHSVPAVIQRTAVVGSGYMGGGIAQVLALSGRDVALTDLEADRARTARVRLIEQAARYVEAGLFPAGAVESLERHLTASPSLSEAVAGADYVTEAVFEDRAVKLPVLRQISDAADQRTIVGTNTSAIPINELAQAVSHPERFLGVHWMNPAPFVPGVELIPSPQTDPAVLARVKAMLVEAGKAPAQVSDSPGFVANRLQFALFKEAVKVVAEGLATPTQVDTVVSNTFGFRLALFGPFAIGDMAGLDVYAASYESLAAEYGERLAAPALLTEMVAAGDLGLKSGHGFLDIDSSEVAELLAYRERAYQALGQLRQTLGPAPGLSDDGDDEDD
ncbi:MAG: 3-hydroxyacyl-CoA dehydrogenase family protein [Propionibacteriaceae bacterium]|jgi:3-hydroxybutyryl-CoA dehydrogenase|nr:3-hydroxyacyl-CoA dehydrogenase family protein [Propionibacteriaceae bacterium]